MAIKGQKFRIYTPEFNLKVVRMHFLCFLIIIINFREVRERVQTIEVSN